MVLSVCAGAYLQIPRQPAPTWIGVRSIRLPAKFRTRREVRQVEVALPGFLEELARSVRSGSSIRTAIADAADHSDPPLSLDLEHLTARLDHGVTLEVALDEWSQRRPDVRSVHLVAVATSMAATVGGSVAQVIDGVADTIRSELDLRAEVRALASQAEASAVLVATLPLVFGVIAGLTDSRTLAFLIGTRIGLISLGVGIGLDLVGLLWMRRITSGIAS